MGPSGNYCSVALCNNSSRKSKRDKTGLSFFGFPKDPALLKQWIKKCKRADSINPSTARICSAHFREEDFERDFRSKLMGIPSRRRLKKNAVPSLNLPLRFSKETPDGLQRREKLLAKKDKEGERRYDKTSNNISSHPSPLLIKNTSKRELVSIEIDVVIKAMNLLNRHRNEHYIFGKFVADELRELSSKSRRDKLQSQIEKAIFAIVTEDLEFVQLLNGS